jgi:uncharacterized membrane protein YgdD (TMEM256/DUF423 family)
MNQTAKTFLLIGSLTALLAVVIGAFGAHGVRDKIPADMLAIYQTGVQYHFYHALGLLGVGLVGLHTPNSAALKWSGWLMLIGMIIFSGSLYLLSLTGLRWLGAITPIGGVAFIAAWALLAIAIYKS